MPVIQIIITLVLLSALVQGERYSFYGKHNCSQTFIDDEKSNYLAYFNLYSDIVKTKCKKTKIIAFRKLSKVEIQVTLKVIDKIWQLLSLIEKRKTTEFLYSHLYTGCNSLGMPQDLCSSTAIQKSDKNKLTVYDTVFITSHDGSLNKNQRICSLCLIKHQLTSQTTTYPAYPIKLNLPLWQIIDLKETDLSDNIISVKFERFADKLIGINNKFTIANIIGRSSNKSDFSVLQNSLLASITFQFEVKSYLEEEIDGNAPNTTRTTVSPTCVFQCGWSRQCLYNNNLICNGISDCSNGYDELRELCNIYRYPDNYPRVLIHEHESDRFPNPLSSNKHYNTHVVGASSLSNIKNILILVIGVLLLFCVMVCCLVALIYYRLRYHNHNHSNGGNCCSHQQYNNHYHRCQNCSKKSSTTIQSRNGNNTCYYCGDHLAGKQLYSNYNYLFNHMDMSCCQSGKSCKYQYNLTNKQNRCHNNLHKLDFSSQLNDGPNNDDHSKTNWVSKLRKYSFNIDCNNNRTNNNNSRANNDKHITLPHDNYKNHDTSVTTQISPYVDHSTLVPTKISSLTTSSTGAPVETDSAQIDPAFNIGQSEQIIPYEKSHWIKSYRHLVEHLPHR